LLPQVREKRGRREGEEREKRGREIIIFPIDYWQLTSSSGTRNETWPYLDSFSVCFIAIQEASGEVSWYKLLLLFCPPTRISPCFNPIIVDPKLPFRGRLGPMTYPAPLVVYLVVYLSCVVFVVVVNDEGVVANNEVVNGNFVSIYDCS
jgi:hypothetical protein